MVLHFPYSSHARPPWGHCGGWKKPPAFINLWVFEGCLDLCFGLLADDGDCVKSQMVFCLVWYCSFGIQGASTSVGWRTTLKGRVKRPTRSTYGLFYCSLSACWMLYIPMRVKCMLSVFLFLLYIKSGREGHGIRGRALTEAGTIVCWLKNQKYTSTICMFVELLLSYYQRHSVAHKYTASA